MRERIAKLLASQGLSVSAFAGMLGVQPSGISHILSGRNNPGYDLIIKILNKFPNVNPDWLLLGEGGIYRNGMEGPYAESRSLKTNDKFAQDAGHSRIEDTTEGEPTLFGVVNDPGGKGSVDKSNTDHRLKTESVYATKPEPNHEPKGYTHNPKAEIERVMIFYSDNTVSTYTLKK